MQVEIINPMRAVSYRRPLEDKDVAEALNTPGYMVRIPTACRCGQAVVVELHSERTCRTDRKRVFYPDEPDKGACVFRCKSCGDVISDTCEHAAFAPNENKMSYGWSVARPVRKHRA